MGKSGNAYVHINLTFKIMHCFGEAVNVHIPGVCLRLELPCIYNTVSDGSASVT